MLIGACDLMLCPIHVVRYTVLKLETNSNVSDDIRKRKVKHDLDGLLSETQYWECLSNFGKGKHNRPDPNRSQRHWMALKRPPGIWMIGLGIRLIDGDGVVIASGVIDEFDEGNSSCCCIGDSAGIEENGDPKAPDDWATTRGDFFVDFEKLATRSPSTRWELDGRGCNHPWVVGQKIRVQDEQDAEDGRFYCGTVTGWLDGPRPKVKIEYDVLDFKVHDLRETKFELLSDESLEEVLPSPGPWLERKPIFIYNYLNNKYVEGLVTKYDGVRKHVHVYFDGDDEEDEEDELNEKPKPGLAAQIAEKQAEYDAALADNDQRWAQLLLTVLDGLKAMEACGPRPDAAGVGNAQLRKHGNSKLAANPPKSKNGKKGLTDMGLTDMWYDLNPGQTRWRLTAMPTRDNKWLKHPGLAQIVRAATNTLKKKKLLGTTALSRDECYIMQTHKVSTKMHTGQKLHCDSGKNGRPHPFGPVSPDHRVPLSALVPLTNTVKLSINPTLTRLIQEGVYGKLSLTAKSEIKKRGTVILELNVGEILVFCHDFVHGGAKDDPNLRMFLSYLTVDDAASDLVDVVVI